MTVTLNQKTNQALLAMGNSKEERMIRKAITATLEDVARVTRDASGNVVGLAVGGENYIDKYRLKNPGRILTKGFMGKFTTAVNGADHTTLIQTVLESDFDAVRLIIPNAVNAQVTGVRAKIGVGGVLGAAESGSVVAAAGGIWSGNILVSGSSSFNLAAGTSGDAPSWTTTDWMNLPSMARTDGGTLPILIVRLFIPAANANRSAYDYADLNLWTTESSVNGRVWRPRTQAVDGVTTLGNFTLAGSVANYGCHPVLIQYASRKTGATVLVIGDSIYEGADANSRHGWQFLASEAVSTTDFPIEICTLSIGGANSTTWRTRLTAAISSVKPDIVVMPGFEINDTSAPMTDTHIRTMRGNIAIALAACRENNATPIVGTGIPRNPTGTYGVDFGATDSLRQDLNEYWRAASDVLIADFDSVIAGEIDADGQTLIATGMTDDALHPNNAGHAVLATEFGKILSNIVARNSV